jgi:hypothetical protein
MPSICFTYTTLLSFVDTAYTHAAVAVSAHMGPKLPTSRATTTHSAAPKNKTCMGVHVCACGGARVYKLIHFTILHYTILHIPLS